MALTNNATKETMALSFTASWVAAMTSSSAEVTGGSYARQQTTWTGGASDGVVTGSQVTLQIPAGTTVTHIGYFAASTGGTVVEYVPITPETFAAAGELKVNPSVTVV